MREDNPYAVCSFSTGSWLDALPAAPRPPPGHYDAGEWMMACGFSGMIAGQVLSQLIDTFHRMDVWTLLEIDIDSLKLQPLQKNKLKSVAAALREARDAGVMSQDGTLSSDELTNVLH